MLSHTSNFPKAGPNEHLITRPQRSAGSNHWTHLNRQSNKRKADNKSIFNQAKGFDLSKGWSALTKSIKKKKRQRITAPSYKGSEASVLKFVDIHNQHRSNAGKFGKKLVKDKRKSRAKKKVQ